MAKAGTYVLGDAIQAHSKQHKADTNKMYLKGLSTTPAADGESGTSTIFYTVRGSVQEYHLSQQWTGGLDGCNQCLNALVAAAMQAAEALYAEQQALLNPTPNS